MTHCVVSHSDIIILYDQFLLILGARSSMVQFEFVVLY